jgi:hypothetical protein
VLGFILVVPLVSFVESTMTEYKRNTIEKSRIYNVFAPQVYLFACHINGANPMTTHGNAFNLPDSFSEQHLQDLMPLLSEEWPQLHPEELFATGGDLEQLVTYISTQTEHTRALTRRHLGELYSLWLTNVAEPTPSRMDELRSHSQVNQLLEDLEARTDYLIKEFKSELLPELEQKARSNLGTTLVITLGLGFILGLLAGGKRG